MEQAEMEKLTKEIIVEFSKTLELFGLSPLEARLFTYLYMTGKALTLDDMSDALGKSKTSISTNIRSLLELNLVQRVWKKGIRKDLYEANNQLFKPFMNNYLNKWIDTTKQQKSSLEDIYASIEKMNVDPTKYEIQDIKSRIKNMIEFHENIQLMFTKARKK